MTMRPVVTLFHSASAAARLDRARAFLGACPTLDEVVVVSATREAADDFVRQWTVERGSSFGFHRFGAAQLVAHLAAQELARLGLSPMTSLGHEALAARAAFDAIAAGELRYFAPVAGTRGFPGSLTATLGELRLARIGAGALDGPQPALADLRVLLHRVDLLIRDGRLADRARLLQIAADTLRRADAPFPGARPLLWLDAAISSTVEREFVDALCARARASLITLPSGDARSIESVRAMECRVNEDEAPHSASAAAPHHPAIARLHVHLFSETASPLPAEPDDAVRFFSAPGEGRECVEVTRLILEEARRGVPFDAMAVVLRSPELYTGLLRAALNRAEIPAWFSRGTVVPDPAGRAFLALLACASQDLSAHAFAEYLSLAQVPNLEADGGPPPPRQRWTVGDDDDGVLEGIVRTTPVEPSDDERDQTPTAIEVDDDARPVLDGSLKAPWNWDRLLVESAVIGGRDRWARRLGGLAREMEIAYAEAQGDEADSPRALRLRRDLADLGHLQRFALPVVDLLAALPRAAMWREWIDALTSLAPRVLRRPARVGQVLAEMRSASAIGPVTLEEVQIVLGERLRAMREEPPRRRYGRLLVCTADELRGRALEVLFVPGLAERLFPQKQREDPLLLDPLRRTLNARGVRLATIEDRVAAERLRLQLAAGAAARRIYFSYPRMEMTESRPRVPSFYALEVERAQRGRIPEPDEFQRRADAAVEARLAWPAPPRPENAIDDAEHDLAVLYPLLRQRRDVVRGRARYLLDLNPALGRSLRMRWQRWEPRWSAADGVYAAGPSVQQAMRAHSLRTRPFSVSALQKFAVCPYLFYLSAILRLEPRAEAVRIERLDPLTRGSMVHRIQAELARQVMQLGTPARAEAARAVLGQFRDTVNRIVDEYYDELAPAIDRVWRDEIEELTADIREWLTTLIAELDRWHPLHAEFGFGFPPGAGRDPMSQRDPVVLEGDWRLHGVIDLIEADAGANALRVTDHKTGSNRTAAGLVVGGGETLQPVLYALAVESALGRPVSEARLSFCTSRGGFTDRVVPIGARQRRSGLEVLEIINRALEAATLVPAPKEGACRWCDFGSICGPHEERRTGAKDPRVLGDLHSLRKMP
jgi:RecB family exonuclease